MGPEKMQAVYWDYLRADVYANEFIRRDSSKNTELENARLQLQVFKLHKITREEFYRSYEYYLEHRGMMKDMLDTMLVRQKQLTAVKTDSSKPKKDSTRSRLLHSFRKLDSIKTAE
ncbi:MAG: DUF4296 domain-containing protein [Rhizobacter sp.]|nr:DUF4296 domain-containing protein [Ferruginibacter sp.]